MSRSLSHPVVAGTAISKTLIAIHRTFNDFESQSLEGQNRAARQRSAFLSVKRARFSPQIGGEQPLPEELYEMNCREELREYLLVERMRRWLSRARYGQDY